MEIEKVLGFLPKDWDSMTISELAALEPVKQQSKTLVRSDIVVRAIAAVLVVCAHAQGVSDKYKLHGAAFVLMMLSGYALYGMMKKEVWHSLTSSLTRLLAVYYAVVVLYFIAKRQISLPHFFLVSSYSEAASSKFAALTPLWFVETYTQVVIIFFIALYIFQRVAKNGDPRYFVLVFFGFACLLRLADLYWLRVGYPLQHTPFNLLMFLAMGLMVRCWIETKGNLLIPLFALALVLYSIVESEVYARWDYIGVLVFGFAMILFQIDLRLPPAAARIPILIAVSSLEIYILHPFVIAALARVHPIGYVPSIILCVGLGVATAFVVKVIRAKVADLT